MYHNLGQAVVTFLAVFIVVQRCMFNRLTSINCLVANITGDYENDWGSFCPSDCLQNDSIEVSVCASFISLINYTFYSSARLLLYGIPKSGLHLYPVGEIIDSSYPNMMDRRISVI